MFKILFFIIVLFIVINTICFFLLKGCAKNFLMLLLGRIITGICGGVSSIAMPLYVAEIASDDIRGTLGE